MKRLLISLLAISIIGFFVACSDDDDDNPDPNNTTNNNNGNNNSSGNVLKAELDGSPTNFTPFVTRTSDSIVFGGFSSNTYPQLSLLLTDTMKAQTYVISNFTFLNPTVPMIQYFRSEQDVLIMSDGSLSISTMDTATNKTIGTFSGVVRDLNSPSDSIVITNGEFDITY